ncbi:MAG: hypothetical protein CL685_00040 [Candidatus Magasanikbacteria bacterium]|nr:hypothetical protein [Candidatus Magasanikbacteria bacterium]|tara:strand:+ start:4860 stop:5492 length:633 start_codon:yes stop_codon:yes gene_type:complete
MFILDFDDTLFNTHQFKKVRKNMVQSLGISDDMYYSSYLLARKDAQNRVTYSDKVHAEYLGSCGFDPSAVFSLLEGVTKQAHTFLFPETIKFLQTLKEKKERVVIVSLGDSDFQKKKIQASGILPFVDMVFAVNTPKKEVIKQIVAEHSEESIYFINDKVKETEEVVQSFPQLTPVLKISKSIPISEYNISRFPKVETLFDIFPLINYTL